MPTDPLLGSPIMSYEEAEAAAQSPPRARTAAQLARQIAADRRGWLRLDESTGKSHELPPLANAAVEGHLFQVSPSEYGWPLMKTLRLSQMSAAVHAAGLPRATASEILQECVYAQYGEATYAAAQPVLQAWAAADVPSLVNVLQLQESGLAVFARIVQCAAYVKTATSVTIRDGADAGRWRATVAGWEGLRTLVRDGRVEAAAAAAKPGSSAAREWAAARSALEDADVPTLVEAWAAAPPASTLASLPPAWHLADSHSVLAKSPDRLMHLLVNRAIVENGAEAEECLVQPGEGFIVVIHDDTYASVQTEGATRAVERCRAEGRRFVTLPVTIRGFVGERETIAHNNMAHSNMVRVDLAGAGVVEHFEPGGPMLMRNGQAHALFHPFALQTAVGEWARKAVGSGAIVRSTVQERFFPQAVEAGASVNKDQNLHLLAQEASLEGYCTYWSLYFAMHRMQHRQDPKGFDAFVWEHKDMTEQQLRQRILNFSLHADAAVATSGAMRPMARGEFSLGVDWPDVVEMLELTDEDSLLKGAALLFPLFDPSEAETFTFLSRYLAKALAAERKKQGTLAAERKRQVTLAAEHKRQQTLQVLKAPRQEFEAPVWQGLKFTAGEATMAALASSIDASGGPSVNNSDAYRPAVNNSGAARAAANNSYAARAAANNSYARAAVNNFSARAAANNSSPSGRVGQHLRSGDAARSRRKRKRK